MKIGFEFNTDQGVATVVGETQDYLYSVHLSPSPKDGEQFDGEITIITAFKDMPERLLGAFRFNDVVEHAANSIDLILPNGHKLFSADECKKVDIETWKVLIKKYRIAPTELVAPSDYS
ncbi:hypothetical protein BC355_09230 [Vibrio cholerae]|uniref:Uncharacterized protein n=1 Tax=Vibrio cholerae TaxID=666 RepID=A0A395U0I8_VIBCL|nr:hypothetical protein [Vibrio cholerae]EGR0524891.1 hypothetical protein [Vibrio cholerae]EGR0592973.1 hypothetical protein [Vibrio cholerae]EGR0600759.1 hypothetical protein [Vibrio cholerae]EJL6307359.1 hypothetical protein [Vibrio cholerae]RGP89891.1 hypothetical protein BC353_10040 [Vibrio cholerae]